MSAWLVSVGRIARLGPPEARIVGPYARRSRALGRRLGFQEGHMCVIFKLYVSSGLALFRLNFACRGTCIVVYVHSSRNYSYVNRETEGPTRLMNNKKPIITNPTFKKSYKCKMNLIYS